MTPKDFDSQDLEAKIVTAAQPNNSDTCDRCGAVEVAFLVRLQPWHYVEWCVRCGLKALAEIVDANDTLLRLKREAKQCPTRGK